MLSQVAQLLLHSVEVAQGKVERRFTETTDCALTGPVHRQPPIQTLGATASGPVAGHAGVPDKAGAWFAQQINAQGLEAHKPVRSKGQARQP